MDPSQHPSAGRGPPPVVAPVALAPLTGEGRAENIKQYYQQLCANYRLVSQQLQKTDLPPQRRQMLQAHHDRLQHALQDFTERVIKPIVAANRNVPAAAPSVPLPGNSSPKMDGLKDSSPKSSSPSVPSSIPSGDNRLSGASPMIPQQGFLPVKRATASPISSIRGQVQQQPRIPIRPVLFGERGGRRVMVSPAVATYLKPFDPNRKNDLIQEKVAVTEERDDQEDDSMGYRANGTPGPGLKVSDLLQRICSGRIEIEPRAEGVVLDLADRFIEQVGSLLGESMRHRKRPSVGPRDLEWVFQEQFQLPRTVAAIPHVTSAGALRGSVIRKQFDGGQSSHHQKMQQLKKHLAKEQS